MRRSLVTALSTAAGIAGVLLLNPTAAQMAEVSSGSSQVTTEQTFTGSTVSTRFGDVAVSVTVQDGSITSVDLLTMPASDPHSAQISQVAGPMLVEQALSAQSADVDGVSGATYTSEGFRESLQSALTQAGL